MAGWERQPPLPLVPPVSPAFPVTPVSMSAAYRLSSLPPSVPSRARRAMVSILRPIVTPARRTWIGTA